jgi:DNA modification methylase
MPEDLLELIIKTSSKEDNLVLDPFGGTGTTSVVAQRMKRKFITLEISNEYYNIILKRLNGKVAKIKGNKKVELEKQKTLFDYM